MPTETSVKDGISEPEKARFLSKVEKLGNGCWKWLAASNRGYGQLKIGKTVWRAHRLSYTIYNGPIPKGLSVLHRCDNPSCVNPDHLFLGTQDDNMKDCAAKGRTCKGDARRKFSIFVGNRMPIEKRLHGEDCKAAKLSKKQVIEIKRLLASGVGYSELAALFGVTRANVCSINKVKSWKHV